jgi:hypothetical protein
MPDDKTVGTPSEVNEKKQKALAKLDSIATLYEDKLPEYARIGIKSAIEEYFAKEKELSERDPISKTNAIKYFDYKTGGGKGLVKTSDIYDIDEATTSDIPNETLYKLFAPQVVENILNDKPIVFPDTWDIGAHYKDMSQIASHAFSRGSKSIKNMEQGKVNPFKESFKDRIDLLANNAKATDIAELFSLNNAKNYKKEISDYDYKKLVADPNEPMNLLPAEKKAAEAFSTLLQRTTGSGRNLGGTIYADLEGNPYQGSAFQPMSSRSSDTTAYNTGYGLVNKLDLSKPVNEQVRNLYTDTFKGKPDNPQRYESFAEGVFTKLSEQGEPIIRVNGGVPQRVKTGSISQLYQGMLDRQKAKISTTGDIIANEGLSVEAKRLFDRYRYLLNNQGDIGAAENSFGVVKIPN